MSYASVMVYVEADGTPEARVRLASSLAEKFNATLIGLSALAVPPPVLADGMVMEEPTPADIELMRAKLADKGEWFRAAARGTRRIEWRAGLDFPVQALTSAARSADLVIVGQMKAAGGPRRTLDPGAAILKLGRPALVVPEGVDSLRAEHVVVGWKDVREARRTVRDAVPFLQAATRVTLVEACGPGEEKTALGRLDDVARYLIRHRIESGPRTMLRKEGSGAAQLIRVAQDERADLLVTGAYGHSRLGEWMFGGMTRELLATCPICCFMSH
ncbi:MAG TPA: universal stress protein [Xanthobacteraceae bacterium]|jgi:nucleotide-binding universal stress UspA family protein